MGCRQSKAAEPTVVEPNPTTTRTSPVAEDNASAAGPSTESTSDQRSSVRRSSDLRSSSEIISSSSLKSEESFVDRSVSFGSLGDLFPEVVSPEKRRNRSTSFGTITLPSAVGEVSAEGCKTRSVSFGTVEPVVIAPIREESFGSLYAKERRSRPDVDVSEWGAPAPQREHSAPQRPFLKPVLKKGLSTSSVGSRGNRPKKPADERRGAPVGAFHVGRRSDGEVGAPQRLFLKPVLKKGLTMSSMSTRSDRAKSAGERTGVVVGGSLVERRTDGQAGRRGYERRGGGHLEGMTSVQRGPAEFVPATRVLSAADRSSSRQLLTNSLKEHFLFSHLTQIQLEDAVKGMRHKFVRQNTHLVLQGETATHFFVCTRGGLHMTQQSSATEPKVVVAQLGPGGSFCGTVRPRFRTCRPTGGALRSARRLRHSATPCARRHCNATTASAR